MKVTQWFPGNVEPIYVGMYQRDCGGVCYSYWNGNNWSECWVDMKNSLKFTGRATYYPELPWRGIAE